MLGVSLPIFLEHALRAILPVVLDGDKPVRILVREASRDALPDKLHTLTRVNFRWVMESRFHGTRRILLRIASTRDVMRRFQNESTGTSATTASARAVSTARSTS